MGRSGDDAAGQGGRPRLILASQSPRRLGLLRQLGVTPAAVVPAEIDETPHRGELPRVTALRLARAKAEAVRLLHPDAIILAADTVVACGRRSLPKAEDLNTAATCLALLSGRRHRVFGALVLIDPSGRRIERVVETRVAFKRLSAAETERYLASGEWHGKAGGYAIQGLAAAFVRWIEGSYSNVVGLPLYETAQALEAMGTALGGTPEFHAGAAVTSAAAGTP